MSGLRPIHGARALLFERLVGLAQPRPEDRPQFVHDRAALERSVAIELERLFSTRAPLDVDRLEARRRSTIDYGVPDFSVFPPRDHSARQRLARHLEGAVAVYEPRLVEPKVTIAETGKPDDALVARIDGKLVIDGVREPVNFSVSLKGAKRDGK